MKRSTPLLEQVIFFGVAGLICWAPMALGSNLGFLTSMIECWVLALTMFTLLGWAGGQIRPAPGLRKGAVPLALLAGSIAVTAIQVIPLPQEIVAVLSPGSARAYLASNLGIQPGGMFVSIERNESVQHLFLSISYWLLIALVFVVVDNGQKLRALCACLVLSGSLQAVLGIALHFSGADYTLFFSHVSHQSAVIGGFFNRNSLAAYLEICLGCGIGLMVAQFADAPMRTVKQRLRWLVNLALSPKLVLRVLLIIMVLALILTRSRMGNGSFFAATLLVGLLGLLLIRNSSRAITIFFASMIAFDVFVVGSWFGVDQVAKRIEQTTITSEERHQSGATEESLEERGVPASAALLAWRDFPLLGAGSGAFAYLYPNYRPAEPTGFYEHAHNDYAEFLVEGGALGFGFLALLYAASMLAAVNAMRDRSDQRRRGIAMGCVFALLTIALHATVDMPLQMPANALAMCVVVAMAWLSASSMNGRTQRAGRRADDEEGPPQDPGRAASGSPRRRTGYRLGESKSRHSGRQ